MTLVGKCVTEPSTQPSPSRRQRFVSPGFRRFRGPKHHSAGTRP